MLAALKRQRCAGRVLEIGYHVNSFGPFSAFFKGLQLNFQMSGIHAVIVYLHSLQFPASCHDGTGSAEICRQPHEYDIIGIDDYPTGQIHSLGRTGCNENLIRSALNTVMLA